MRLKYDQTLAKVLTGDLDSAAKDSFSSRDAIADNPDQFLERQLISFRLALKSGNSSFPVESLQENLTKNDFLRAEILFCKGSYYGQFYDHKRAAMNFSQAENLYQKTQSIEKKLLSRFNTLVAKSHLSEIVWSEEEFMFRQLILECHNLDQKKTEFLCLRHLSYRLFELKNYQQAIQLIISWVGRKDVITKSDSELALVHIADCYFEMRDLRNALFYIEQVSANCDERVRFPREYVKAKIFQLSFDQSQFSYISDYWKTRSKSWRQQALKNKPADLQVVWNTKTNILSKGKSVLAKIKPQSLEGQILKHLSASPKSKSHLCECLWPDEMTTDFLDDRFHQLVQRLNRKIKGIVVFDGQLYRLSMDVDGLEG